MPGLELLQVPLNLVHHLMSSDVFKRPSTVGLALVAKAKNALCRLAHQGKAVFVPLRILKGLAWRSHKRILNKLYADIMPTFLFVA